MAEFKDRDRRHIYLQPTLRERDEDPPPPLAQPPWQELLKKWLLGVAGDAAAAAPDHTAEPPLAQVPAPRLKEALATWHSRMDRAQPATPAQDVVLARLQRQSLREVLDVLAPFPDLRAATIAAADPAIAPPVRSPRGRGKEADGTALWRASARRAATLYRRGAGGGDAQSPEVQAALARCGDGEALSAEVRTRMERALGVRLGRVRIHTDAVAADAARAVNADAFTVGDDVFFAAGMFDPQSPSGLKLLAHELAHVAQGMQGRTRRTDAVEISQPHDPLEREAEAVAERVDAHDDARSPGETSQPTAARDEAVPAGPRNGMMHRAPAASGSSGTDAVGEASLANMQRDAAFIVEKLKQRLFSQSDQRAIVEKFEPYVRADEKLLDLKRGDTRYLDKFIAVLKSKAYQRSSLVLEGPHAIVFDDLFARLQGESLGRFKAIAQRSAVGVPGAPTEEPSIMSVVSPVFWTATALLSFGLVEQKLFDEMYAATTPSEQLAVLTQHVGKTAIDILTFGAARPAYEAAVKYATDHPDCSLMEIRRAGLFAAGKAILPIEESKRLAKALGIMETDAGEMKPGVAEGVQAFFEGALKVITIGAVIHQLKASPKGAKSSTEVRDQLAAKGKGKGKSGTGPEKPGTAGGGEKPTTTTERQTKGHAEGEVPGADNPKGARFKMTSARQEILKNARRAAEIPDLLFWEQVPLGSIFEGVRAGPVVAEALGVAPGTVIGYRLLGGKVTGSAIGDLGNITELAAPYPDPFPGAPKPAGAANPPTGAGPNGKSAATSESQGKQPARSERGTTTEKGSGGTNDGPHLDVPQGLTAEKFQRVSELVRGAASKFGSDIVVQGSRAKGSAKPTSDIDIAIRVDEAKFNAILEEAFHNAKPGNANSRTKARAAESGKIQRGELRLRQVGKQIEAILGLEVDISVIKIGGPFDTPPFIPLK